MKKFYNVLVGCAIYWICGAIGTAYAQSDCASRLMPVFTSNQANQICTRAGLANNTYLKVNNAAKSALIDVLMVDSNDDTALNADSGNQILLTIAGSTMYTLEADGDIVQNATNGGSVILSKASTYFTHGLTGALDADVTGDVGTPRMIISGDMSSNHSQAFIATGANASGNNLAFFKTRATTADGGTVVSANDDVGLISFYSADGVDFESTAAIAVESDAASGSNDVPGRMVFYTTPDGSATLTEAMRITSGQVVQVASTFTSTRTSDLGWAVVAGANTACNTTCTNACVFGVNTAATEADIVGCADATADECLCAGAS